MWIGSFKYDGKDIYFGTTTSGGTTKLCGTKDQAAIALADLENEDGKNVGVSEVYAMDVVLCQRQLLGNEDIVERTIILKCMMPGRGIVYRVYLETGFIFLDEKYDLREAATYANDHWEP